MKRLCGIYGCRDRGRYHFTYTYEWQLDMPHRYYIMLCGTHAKRSWELPAHWVDVQFRGVVE